MTMAEIQEFFGFKTVNAVSNRFRLASKEHPEIKAKMGTSTTRVVPDFTLEECLTAFQYNIKDNFQFTPAAIVLFKEAFIQRDTPMKIKQKQPRLTQSQKSFIRSYQYFRNRSNVIIERCATCRYFKAQTMNRTGARPSPFCSFYNVYLNKALPKRDVYMDKCPTFLLNYAMPIIITPQGIYKVFDFNSRCILKQRKEDSSMLGIEQSAFKKRKRGEDVIILKDAFSD